MIEKKRVVRKTYTMAVAKFSDIAAKALGHVTPYIERFTGNILYKITKNVEFHPEGKRLIQAQIKAWT